MQKFDRVSHFMSATRGNVRGKVAVSQIKVDGDLSARLSRVAGRSRKRHHCQRHPNHRWQVVGHKRGCLSTSNVMIISFRDFRS